MILAWIFISFLTVSNLILWLVCIAQHKMIIDLQGRTKKTSPKNMSYAEKQGIVDAVKKEIIKATAH